MGIMHCRFAITRRDGRRVDYGEVDLEERGTWFFVRRDGREIASYNRRELLSWSYRFLD